MRAAKAVAQGEKWVDTMVGGRGDGPKEATILPDPFAARANRPTLSQPRHEELLCGRCLALATSLRFCRPADSDCTTRQLAR